MGHNLSQRKVLSQTMAVSLGQFRGQPSILSITCGTCRNTRELRLSVLGERYGSDILLGTLIPRLRCRDCRSTPYTVKLLAKSGATSHTTLKGPGAY